METSLKTGFVKLWFLLLPKKSELPKIWVEGWGGGGGRTSMNRGEQPLEP